MMIAGAVGLVAGLIVDASRSHGVVVDRPVARTYDDPRVRSRAGSRAQVSSGPGSGTRMARMTMSSRGESCWNVSTSSSSPDVTVSAVPRVVAHPGLDPPVAVELVAAPGLGDAVGEHDERLARLERGGSLHGPHLRRAREQAGRRRGAHLRRGQPARHRARLRRRRDELRQHCDLVLQARPYIYTETPEDRDRIEAEAEAARRAGLPASLVEAPPTFPSHRGGPSFRGPGRVPPGQVPAGARSRPRSATGGGSTRARSGVSVDAG